MEILFFVTTLGGGGAEKVLVDLIKNINKTKYKITVYSLFNEGIYNEEIKEIVEYKCFFNKYSDNLFIRKLKNWLIFRTIKLMPAIVLHKLLIRENYDLEVAFLEGVSTKIISGARYSKKIAWVHTDLITFPGSTKSFLSARQEKKAYKKFNDIFCVSSQVKDAFEKKYDLNAQVQYNVLDNYEIVKKSNSCIESPLDPINFKIISVGRLVEQKAFDRLLRVHKRLINEGFNHRLYILGEGKERSVLEEYIFNNNLCDSVELLGFKENPYKYMKLADLFVCSSITEGFSTVVTEATILELPIVTTDCAGMYDLLGDSEFGLITENSEDGLYKGLKSILQDKELYNHYKKKSAERGKYFCLETRIEEYEKLFDGIIRG